MQPNVYYHDEISNILQHAHGYAQAGMVPMPIPRGSKRPHIKGWQNLDPQAGLAEVQQALQFGPCNLGVRTGVSFLAIDCDVKEGLNGYTHLVKWFEAHGLPLETLLAGPIAETGGGGIHFLFAMPPGLKITTRTNVLQLFDIGGGRQVTGVDVRGTGGQIVVQPSLHDSGRHYRWVQDPWHYPLLPLPEPLLRALSEETRRATTAVRTPRPEDTPSRDSLEDVMSRLALKRGSRSDARKARDVLALLDGKVIAPDGGGHDAFVAATELIGRRYPFADTVRIMEYLRPGIEARVAAGGKTSFFDVERALRGAQERYVEQALERETGWRSSLALNDEGVPKTTQANVLIVLREHEDWIDVFGYNERTTELMFLRPPPLYNEPSEGARAISENDDVRIVEWFHRHMGMNVQGGHVRAALLELAEKRRYDPFKIYLESLKWDGVPRIDRWIIDYMGADDTPLNRLYARKWLIQMIARTLSPGCQADHCLVAIGEQGTGKSSAFRALLPPDRPEWFRDRLSALHGKDALQELQGPVLVELNELQVLKQVQVQEDAKVFLTIRYDSFRKPYAREVTEHPRKVVFCGTTNDYSPFRDATGARRFWTFVSKWCDVAGLQKVAPQLIAEAVHAYNQGELWWLDREESRLAEIAQREFFDEPVLTGKLEGWLRGGTGGARATLPPFVPSKEIFENALGVINPAEQGKLARQISDAMTFLGYRKKRIRANNEQYRGWVLKNASDEEIQNHMRARVEVARARGGGTLLN